MSDATAILDPPRKKGGRPATGQRDIPVQVMLFDAERRRLDALLTAQGKNTRGRASFLRNLLVRELEAAGVEDPGPTMAAEVTAA